MSQLRKFLYRLTKRIGIIFPSKFYLRLLYYFETGHCLHLKEPRRFTEKIQWLKLFGFKPVFTSLVDKIAAKKIVSEKIGDEYIIPTIAIYNKPEDIEFDRLPNQFVLKTTNGGGNNGVIICRDKSRLNRAQTIDKISKALEANIYTTYREKPYKDIPPQIFVEQYMQNEDNSELTDYKFYCFKGKPKYCQVIANRNTNESIDFFDMDWVHQSFYGLNRTCKNSNNSIPCPKNFEKMKVIAGSLSNDLEFLRVDLYEINNRIYFGEMTFYPGSGFGAFTPDIWDYILGDLIELPKTNNP